MITILHHPFWQRAGQFLTHKKTIFWLCVLVAVFCAIKQYKPKTNPEEIAFGLKTSYNNFLIFKYSFWHFIESKNLYLSYVSEYGDFYLYGPLFPILMAPLAVLPDFMGLLIWNLLNTLIFWLAICQLPISQKKQCLVLWIAFNTLYTSLLNSQIHPLSTALIVMSYTQVHRKNDWLATLFILLGTFIKLYGIVGFVFFFFSKQKKKFILYSLLWTVVLFFLPVLFSDLNYVLECYKNWYEALASKSASNFGSFRLDKCVMGMFRRLFHDYTLSDLYFLAPSLLLFGLTLLKADLKNVTHQMMILASVLMYIILASSGAETPTYIVAFAGVGIWYVLSERTTFHQVLFWTTLAISSFTPTDLMPSFIRNHIIYEYGLLPLPLFITWLALHRDLIRKHKLRGNSLPH